MLLFSIFFHVHKFDIYEFFYSHIIFFNVMVHIFFLLLIYIKTGQYFVSLRKKIENGKCNSAMLRDICKNYANLFTKY